MSTPEQGFKHPPTDETSIPSREIITAEVPPTDTTIFDHVSKIFLEPESSKLPKDVIRANRRESERRKDGLLDTEKRQKKRRKKKVRAYTKRRPEKIPWAKSLDEIKKGERKERKKRARTRLEKIKNHEQEAMDAHYYDRHVEQLARQVAEKIYNQLKKPKVICREKDNEQISVDAYNTTYYASLRAEYKNLPERKQVETEMRKIDTAIFQYFSMTHDATTGEPSLKPRIPTKIQDRKNIQTAISQLLSTLKRTTGILLPIIEGRKKQYAPSIDETGTIIDGPAIPATLQSLIDYDVDRILDRTNNTTNQSEDETETVSNIFPPELSRNIKTREELVLIHADVMSFFRSIEHIATTSDEDKKNLYSKALKNLNTVLSMIVSKSKNISSKDISVWYAYYIQTYDWLKIVGRRIRHGRDLENSSTDRLDEQLMHIVTQIKKLDSKKDKFTPTPLRDETTHNDSTITDRPDIKSVVVNRVKTLLFGEYHTLNLPSMVGATYEDNEREQLNTKLPLTDIGIQADKVFMTGTFYSDLLTDPKSPEHTYQYFCDTLETLKKLENTLKSTNLATDAERREFETQKIEEQRAYFQKNEPQHRKRWLDAYNLHIVMLDKYTIPSIQKAFTEYYPGITMEKYARLIKIPGYMLTKSKEWADLKKTIAQETDSNKKRNFLVQLLQQGQLFYDRISTGILQALNSTEKSIDTNIRDNMQQDIAYMTKKVLRKELDNLLGEEKETMLSDIDTTDYTFLYSGQPSDANETWADTVIQSNFATRARASEDTKRWLTFVRDSYKKLSIKQPAWLKGGTVTIPERRYVVNEHGKQVLGELPIEHTYPKPFDLLNSMTGDIRTIDTIMRSFDYKQS